LLLAEDGGPIVAANRSLCIFLGYRRRDLVGAALFDLAPALPPGVRIDGRDGFGRRIEWRQGDGTTLECPTWVLPTTIAGAAFLLVLVAPAAG
jgi:PAS domain-containing protein